MNALTTTLYELLADNVPSRAEKVALVDKDRTISYGALCEEVGRVAGHMARRGVRPGDRVGTHLRKGICEVVTMFAATRVGAVVVNVNPQWTAEQLRYVADDCQLKWLAVEPRSANSLLRSGLPASVETLVVTGEPPAEPRCRVWSEALQAEPVDPVPRLDTELAMIIYTSGSTGKPKGVMLSHRNLVAGARSVARYLRLREDDRLLSVLPYSFDYGLNQLTTMLLLGGTVVHQPLSMPTEVARSLAEQHITGFAAVPPLWNQLVRLLDEAPVALPSLRRITNSGGKIPRPILELMPKVFPGVDIYLMYGLTEAFRSTYLDPACFSVKAGAIGRAIPGAETYIIKPGVGIAGPGEQGELVHRGPLVSPGYWGKPEATAEKIRPCPELRSLIGDEPVVYSGDTVRIDEDGDYWFVGRNDTMLKASGFRVSPDEVEDLVAQSGLVGDVVAFGVDHEDFGHAIHVAVSPLPGFDEGALVAHCRRAMPSYMVPAGIHVWDVPMPRTGSGKLAKPEVIQATRARLGGEDPS
ncbi:MAG: AMP-binding protein [Polyangiaceae bacterium]|nr:AMP-binding protein [Polyangiaceae bacterium]